VIQREAPLQNFSENTPGFGITGALILGDGTLRRSRSVLYALAENHSNSRLGLIASTGASPMNTLQDKTVDCLEIRFPVTRGRRRSAFLGLRLDGSPAKRSVSRTAMGGVAVTFPEIELLDCRRATWRKPSLRAIAPRTQYPFAPLVCAAAAPRPVAEDATQDAFWSR